MEIPGWLWVAFTVAAAASQTVRNAMQRTLTERLGTLGATHVRFLFGLPFALVFLAVTLAAFGTQGLRPGAAFAGWVLTGALAQIGGTALMLATMRERSFVVTTAYLKTEPVQLALLGLVFLGERLGAQASAGVLVATAGVMLMSLPGRAAARPDAGERAPLGARLRPALLGLASGGLFALAAIGFRAAIVALGDAPFYVRSTVTLATTLGIQTALLSAWLLARTPAVLAEILRSWRPSLLAGAAGAVSSQFWFLAFSLQTAAAVRTVSLIEILFAQAASRRLFAQRMSAREGAGIALMIAGVLMLLNA